MKIKNILMSIIISLGLTGLSVQKSNAAIHFGTGGATSGIGFYLTVGYAGLSSYATISCLFDNCASPFENDHLAGAIFGALLTVLILDDNQNPVVSFQAPKSDVIKGANLNSNEVSAMNDEFNREILNAILNDKASKVNQTTENDLVKIDREIEREISSALGTDVASAYFKIRAFNSEQILKLKK